MTERVAATLSKWDGEDLERWAKRCGFETPEQAYTALGMSRASYYRVLRFRHNAPADASDKPVPITRTLEYACRWIEHQIKTTGRPPR